MKRIISFILIALFIIPSTCYAYSDVSDYNLNEKLRILSEMSIINGYEDETFRPYNNITRAEFTKIIMSTIRVDSSFVGEGVFNDTFGHWAEEYISLAKHFGIINGTTELTFSPEEKVTYEQAIKMIVAALGYNDQAIAQGGYPYGYIAVADKLGILNDIECSYIDNATRENISKIIYNALNVPFYFLINSEAGSIEYEEAQYTLRELYDIQSSMIVEYDEDYLNYE